MENDFLNFGELATGRSHKVHPDSSRVDEFNHSVIIEKNEGPGENAMMFTFNRQRKEEKRSARRRKKRRETEKE